MRMTTWHLICNGCGHTAKVLCWDYELPHPCEECSGKMHTVNDKYNSAPGVIGDELHDYAANHGVCHPDGTPRKFDSRTDLKRALNRAGLVISGDTPKPYRI